jgi:predicted nuclease of restriction endonuclease-like (RecB) superfamily
MLKFAELFPDERIVATLSQQLSWSHFVEILPLKEPLKRDFYAEMCRIEKWNVRTLRKKIDSMLYERKNPISYKCQASKKTNQCNRRISFSIRIEKPVKKF